MLDLNLPKVNMDSAEDGKWFDYNDTLSFKIAMDGNPAHKRAIMAKNKQLTKMRERNEIKRIEHLNNELVSRFILKDWKGVKDASGKVIKYDEDVGLMVMSDPQYESIKNFVIDTSRDSAEYEAEEIEEITKNS